MNSDTAMTQKKGEHLTNGSIFNEKRFISDLYVCETIKEILMDRIKKLKSDLYWLGTDKKDLNIPSFEQSKFRQEYNREGKQLLKYPQKPKEPYVPSLQFCLKEILEQPILFALGIITGVSFVGFLIVTALNQFVFCEIIENLFGSSEVYEEISGIVLMIVAIFVAFYLFYLSLLKEPLDKYFTGKRVFEKYQTDMQQYKSTCVTIDKNNDEIKASNNKLWSTKKEKYNEWVSAEKAKYQAYSEEYERNRTIKEYLLKQELDAAQHELSKVNKTLISLYTLKINGVYCIHPNYQGLISISVIYGYFDTGRCSTLRGHEGAYNLYEDEKIKGIIIDQLGEISCELKHLNASMCYVGYLLDNCEKQLETLNENMETLISETSRMNANINESFFDLNSNISGHFQGIENQVGQIEANTANSAYYSEVGAKMSTLNTFYNIGKDL